MTDNIKLPELGEMTLHMWQDCLVHYNKELTNREHRITQLEDALKEILSLGEWGANPLARYVALEALETKYEQLKEGA
jgi:hypothetical protein